MAGLIEAGLTWGVIRSRINQALGLSNTQNYYVSAFGDDATAFASACVAAMTSGRRLIIDQNISINQTVAVTLTNDLEIVGLNKPTITVSAGAEMRFTASVAATTTLASNILEGATVLPLTNAVGVKPEMLIAISSNERPPDSVDRPTLKKRHLALVTHVDGNSVHGNYPAAYPFETAASVALNDGTQDTPTTEATIYNKRCLSLSNLHLQTSVAGLTDGRPNVLELTGLTNARLHNIDWTNSDEVYQGAISSDGSVLDRTGAEASQNWVSATYIIHCWGTHFQDVSFKHIGYGVSCIHCVNTLTERAYGYQCRHIGIHNQGSHNYVMQDSTMIDCWAGMDSHQGAFDAHYIRCTSSREKGGVDSVIKFRGRFDHLTECSFTDTVVKVVDLGMEGYYSKAVDRAKLGLLAERCYFGGTVNPLSAVYRLEIKDCGDVTLGTETFGERAGRVTPDLESIT